MEEEIVQDGVTYIREDLMDAVIRQYRIERDEALEHICTKNERAFLDEIRENGNYIIAYNKIEIKHDSDLYQSDFTKCNLSELVEGKG